MKIIDLSQEVFQGQPVYPGHQPTVIFPMTNLLQKDDGKWTFAVNTILMSEHAGTHTDSFIHMDPNPDAKSIEELRLEKFLGHAVCLDVSHVPDSEFITRPDLEKACKDAKLTIAEGGTVLLYTGTYERHFPKPVYNQKNSGLDRESAEWLADQGVVNIGIDSVSIDVSPHKGEEWKPAHTVCRERGILNTENLGDLRPVAGKSFFYIGLPLKIHKGTAGPTRAVALMDAQINME
ncbi:cyclase family protein [Peribacillus cavernae]|uniref:Cyclase family protein n=1 Tax=Peribacillus cavernae TaxID=1674310 RepID=A0A433HRH0_9BACI|nr:cyclase family protein [Peribacillus cavernae]MDQ0218748.1 kynurenine formamidase [Peribacillus cavernae]RUQ30961.1 cyclase family protein [Peribacillus cavernae]